jgi:hypothetical protein
LILANSSFAYTFDAFGAKKWPETVTAWGSSSWSTKLFVPGLFLDRDRFLAEVGGKLVWASVFLGLCYLSLALPGLTPFEARLLTVWLFRSNLSKNEFKSLATAGLWSLAIVLKTSSPSFS